MEILQIVLQWLGSVLAFVMPYAFDILHMPRFPESVSFIILLVMFFVLVRCLLQIRPTRMRLTSIVKTLESIKPANGKYALASEAEGHILDKNDVLTTCWSSFRATCIEHNGNEYRTAQPENYFNIHTLELDSPLRRFGKWAGLFVGVGLFFTFLGLVTALDSATQAIQAATSGGNSTSQMQNALKGLLSAATVKFYTSIFGLLASIVVGYMEKRFRRQLTKQINQLGATIQLFWPMITPEMLLAEQVREAQQTTSQLKAFNSEMSQGLMTLSGAMAKSLQDSIIPVRQGLDQVGENIGSMEQAISRSIGENLRSMQTEALSMITNQLGSAVGQHAGSELHSLANTLQKLELSLSGMQSALDQGSGNFASTLNDTLQKLQNGIKDFTEAAQSISYSLKEDMNNVRTSIQQQQAEFVNGMTTGAARATDKITQATTTFMESMLEKMDHSLTSVKDSLEQGSGHFANTLQDTMTMLHGGISNLTSATESISQNLKEDMDQARGLMKQQQNELAHNMREEGSKAAGQINEATQTILFQITNSFEVLGSKTQRLSQSLMASNEALEQHQTHINSATNTLLSASTALNNASLPIHQQIVSMNSAVKNLLDSVSIMQQNMQITHGTLQDATKSLQESWRIHLSRFEGVDAELANALQSITDNLNNNTSKVNEFVQKIDKNLASAVSQLSDGINELGDVLDKHSLSTNNISHS